MNEARAQNDSDTDSEIERRSAPEGILDVTTPSDFDLHDNDSDESENAHSDRVEISSKIPILSQRVSTQSKPPSDKSTPSCSDGRQGRELKRLTDANKPGRKQTPTDDLPGKRKSKFRN